MWTLEPWVKIEVLLSPLQSALSNLLNLPGALSSEQKAETKESASGLPRAPGSSWAVSRTPTLGAHTLTGPATGRGRGAAVLPSWCSSSALVLPCWLRGLHTSVRVGLHLLVQGKGRTTEKGAWIVVNGALWSPRLSGSVPEASG